MTLHVVKNRHTGREIARIESPTAARAVEGAVIHGVRLGCAGLAGIDARDAYLAGGDFRDASFLGADLRGCCLRGAHLVGADCRFARLNNAHLGWCDLRSASLHGADLSQANLRGANLAGADLRDCLLVNAKLDGAMLDWRWSSVPCEILRRSPSSGEAAEVLAKLAFDEDKVPYGWVSRLYPAFGWAARRLSPFVRRGDNAPGWLMTTRRDIP